MTEPTTGPATGPYADPWIRRYHAARDGAPPLVCLPHAGGGAGYYFPLSKRLSPDFEVLAIQYPGRQDRLGEPCVSDVRALAEEISLRLRSQVGGPLTLFGHSMGATIAYEVAKRLEYDGIAVTHLFASAARGPACERNGRVHLMDDDGVLAEMRRLGGTDEQLLREPELLRMVLDTVRGDYRAIETYRYTGGVLACPVTALVGDDDPSTSVALARTWAEQTRGAFDLRVFTGGHFYLNDHFDGVAGEIRSVLTRTQ